jgi:hypothetical protein
MLKFEILQMYSQDNVKTTGPASVARARSSALSGCCVVTTANAAPFIPGGAAAVPFPFAVIFNGVYTGALSWLTQPTSNCLPASVTNVICAGSHSNSRRGDLVELVAIGSETFRAGSMGNGISTQQDPGTINERARLYAQMSLMPVSKGAGLGTFPSRCRKKAS